MQSITSPRPSVKTKRKPLDRHVSISAPVHGVLAVKLTVGKDSFGYYLEKIPSAWGEAFRFSKFTTEQVEGEPTDYVVLIDEAGNRHQCECKGFCRFGMTAGRNRTAGHQGCKHVACVVELIRQGRIDATRIRTATVQSSNPQPQPEPIPEEEETVEIGIEPPQPAKCCFECGRPSEGFYCDRCGYI